MFRVLSGPAAFAKKSPRSSALREALSLPVLAEHCRPARWASSLRLDRPDCKRHQAFAGWDALEASFTDERATRGASCRSRKLDPWYGGVIIDAKHHVQLMRGYPAHPLIQCAICF